MVDYFLTHSLVTNNLKARETSAFKKKVDFKKKYVQTGIVNFSI